MFNLLDPECARKWWAAKTTNKAEERENLNKKK